MSLIVRQQGAVCQLVKKRVRVSCGQDNLLDTERRKRFSSQCLAIKHGMVDICLIIWITFTEACFDFFQTKSMNLSGSPEVLSSRFLIARSFCTASHFF
jgi:hypothetical protein